MRTRNRNRHRDRLVGLLSEAGVPTNEIAAEVDLSIGRVRLIAAAAEPTGLDAAELAAAIEDHRHLRRIAGDR